MMPKLRTLAMRTPKPLKLRKAVMGHPAAIHGIRASLVGTSIGGKSK
jgi:hypothetical protein